jgi:hypothetical protein
MNATVKLKGTQLDWSEGLASLFETWVELEKNNKEYTNLNMLHRAGTYVRTNIQTMSLNDLKYHLSIIQKGVYEIFSSSGSKLMKKKNAIECVEAALESLCMIQDSNVKLDTHSCLVLSYCRDKLKTVV